MYIANPFYDVFFKFLMEDLSLAKRLISAITEEDIVDLVFAPQEVTINSPKHFLSVLRLDFKAVIRTQAGKHKTVLIELQKGKVAFDILRFRKYLAKNYERKESLTNAHKSESLPIIAIYFLRFELETIKVAVLKVSHQYQNALTKQILPTKDEFVEQLIHDCFVIQVPLLPTQTQTKLEKVLSIFNQTYMISSDARILDIPQVMLQDPELADFVKRMGIPLQDPQMLLQAQAEEELDEHLDNAQRKIEEQEKALEEKDKKLSENKKELSEKDEKLSEKEKELSEKDKELSEKDKLIEALQKQLENLK